MAASVDDGARRIGGNVRAARKYRSLSVQQLADLVGHSKSWVSKVENGATRLERRSDIRALAEALKVSAADILGEPAPAIRPQERAYGDIIRLREVLLESSLDNPRDTRARTVRALSEVVDSDIRRHRQAADDARLTSGLPPVIAELHIHVAVGGERDREWALRLLVDLCTSATNVLRHLGQVDLAWIAADRAERAARMLDDPVMVGAAAFARAGARPTATLSNALLDAEQAAERLKNHLGDDRTAHEVYGMLQLYAALARHLQEDPQGAADRIDEADRIAQRLGEQPPDSTGEGWQSFGPANVGVWRTMLAVESEEPEIALQAARKVRVEALPRRSRKAALAIEQGRALAMLGRNGDAVAALRRAEKLSVASVHKNPLVRELVADLYDNAVSRELRGLAWRMNLI